MDPIMLVLLILGGIVLLWAVYKLGQADKEDQQARLELERIIQGNLHEALLRERSHDQALNAIRAGDNAGPAPVNPDELRPEVHSRVLKTGG